MQMKKMMIKNSILTVLSCAILSGCAALGSYKPVTEAADNQFGDLVTPTQGQSIANIKWQDMFTDPTLQEYINLALENNYDLLATEEHIRQAEAALLGAKLAYTPGFGLQPVFQTNFRGDKLETQTYSYKLNAAASWQLTPMRLINNQKSAQASVEKMEYARQSVMAGLVSEVANGYYTILMLDAQYATALEMQNAWKKSVETIKAMKEAGLADQVAVSQYEANYNKISITVLSLAGQIKATENVLCLLIGSESKHGIKRGLLAEQTISYDMSIGLPVQMLALRPDVRAAQQDMELAFYATKGALLNYFPALSITGGFGLTNPLSGAVSPMTLLAEVGAGLVAPIFKSGANRSALKIAESRQKEARIAFDKTLMSACKEVNDYCGALSTATHSAELYKVQVEALDKARKDTEYLMLNSFDKTYLDVLYANTTYFDAVLAMISNQTKRMQAYVGLYTALGGGII